MGTMNISSMNLRAVNTTASKPQGVKKKRPKFTTKKVSTAQKIALSMGAAALLAAAFLLPPAPLDHVLEGEKLEAAAAAVLPEQEVKRLSSSEVAKARISFQSAVVEKANGLEPLSVALPFAPTTPSETAIALQVLAKYAQSGSDEQKKEAQTWLVGIRKEYLNQALPSLLRTHETAALGFFAKIAASEKIPGAFGAIIDRLNSKAKLAFAQDELLKALTAFSTEPEVQAFFDTALDGEEPLRSKAWAVMGEGMSEKHVQLALKRVMDGNGDWESAAKALGRYASTSQAAAQLLSAAQKNLNVSSQDQQIRFTYLLGEMDPSVATSRLRMLAIEQNEHVRAAAVQAMGKNPDNSEVIAGMLKQDESLLVKTAAIAALAQNPNEAAVQELITLLNNQNLRGLAKRALVAANKGNDLGWNDFHWQAWFDSRK